MNFKLVSEYTPTGDQPSAIAGLTQSIQSQHPHQTLLGVTGSGKTYTLANVIQNLQMPTLVISHNKTLAAQLYQEFRDFFPENAVNYFVSYYDYYQPESYIPATDTYIEKETDINDEIDKLRLSTTTNLLTRPDVIVVASVSCIYNLGSPAIYAKNYIRIKEGQILDRHSLISRLVDIQYERNDYELTRGAFSVAGDTIRIWPADEAHILKLEFLDKTIQSIQVLDQLTGEDLTNQVDWQQERGIYYIYPAKHFQTPDQNLNTIFDEIKSDLAKQLQNFKDNGKIVESYRLAQKVKYDLDMIQELGYVSGIENYSRYFDGRNPGDPPFSLFDYFKYNSDNVSDKSFLTIIDESHITIPQLRGMYAGDRSRKQNLIDYGFRLPSALDNRPLKFEETLQRMPQAVYSSATPESWELEQSSNQVFEQLIRPTGLVDPTIDIRPIKNQVHDLIKEIMLRKIDGQRVLVTTLTKKTAEALTEFLNDADKMQQIAADHDIRIQELPRVQYLHADVNTLDRSDILNDLRTGQFDVVVGINLLREGLDLPEVSLVGILDADKEGFLRSRTSLIQTMGRAARHKQGHVILYADKVTKSMQAAMDEVERRRQIQTEYNHKHNITPESIQKPIREQLLQREDTTDPSSPMPKDLQKLGWHSLSDIDPSSLTPKDKNALKKDLKKKMNQAAKDWDFEAAAAYRDSIKKLR